MSKKKKWFFYDGDLWDFGWEKKKKGYSASSYWTSRFGGSSWWWEKGDADAEENEKYKEALKTVSRTVNIYTESQKTESKGAKEEVKDDAEFTVRWSDGVVSNSLTNKIVHISPDVVSDKYTKKKEWTSDERIDVLVGDALTESAFKHVALLAAEHHAHKEWAGKDLTKALWKSSEIVASHAHVVTQYPGFKAYFEAYRDYYTGEKAHKQLQQVVMAKKPDARVAVAATMWQLIHPDEPLEIPKETYGEEIDTALEMMSKTRTSIDRAQTAREIVERFLKKWPQDKNNPPPSLPRYIQNMMRGEGMGMPNIGTVPNKTNKRLSKQEGPAEVDGDGKKERTLKFHGISLGEDPPRGVLDVKVKAHRSAAYEEVRHKMQPLSMKLASSLRIRNEDIREYERGLKTGEVDAGAIYKLGFRKHGVKEDTLFERADVVSMPDVGVVLVVDESGSMGTEAKCGTARKLAVMMANAFKLVRGVQYAVFGHTGHGACQNNLHTTGMAFHHYFTPEYQSMDAMGNIASFSENYDGYAVKRAAEYTLLWWPKVAQKMVIHFSDGLPAAPGYGGEQAYRHVNRVCNRALRHGIRVVNIHVGTDYGEDAYQSAMSQMYGDGNWIHVDDPKSSIQLISNLVTRSLSAVKRMEV